MKRFWKKVNKTDSCWLWVGGSRGNGYGAVRYLKKTHDAHRFVWFLEYGHFPKKYVLHKCGNRACVNPGHLYEGTAKQNYDDMRAAGNAFISPKIYTEEQLKERESISNKKYYEKLKKDPVAYARWRKSQHR